MRVKSIGKGHGIAAELDNAANNKAVFKGVTNGTGQVLYAEQSGNGNAVTIEKTGGVGKSLEIEVLNPFNDTKVVTVNTIGDGDVLDVGTAGLGNVVLAEIANAASPSFVINARSNGTGQVINAVTTGSGGVMMAKVDDPDNAAIALNVLHTGSGPGILSVLTKATNPAPAIGGVTNGVGPSVVAHIDNVASGAEALFATTNGTGNAIFSDHTGMFGTALNANVVHPLNAAPTIRAVTGGLGSALEARIESDLSDGSVITANTIGEGKAIEAIISNPGSTAPVIKALGDHDGIGVFAHLVRPDGTGNAVVGYTAGTSAAALFSNTNEGPDPLQSGVMAGSSGFSEEAAGVVAIGNGAHLPGEPRAAALRIANGAVTVSGFTRPAGTIELDTSVWLTQETCEMFCPDSCFHKHQVGQYAEVTLFNELIKGDSIILLTVRTEGDVGDDRTYYAQISGQSSGLADIRVSAMGNDPGCLTPDPGEFIKVHYFIINPLEGV